MDPREFYVKFLRDFGASYPKPMMKETPILLRPNHLDLPIDLYNLPETP